MKYLLTFIIVNLFFYGLFAFVCMETNPLSWHWGARIIAVFLEIGIINTTFKD